jgi:hypothetical protein
LIAASRTAGIFSKGIKAAADIDTQLGRVEPLRSSHPDTDKPPAGPNRAKARNAQPIS